MNYLSSGSASPSTNTYRVAEAQQAFSITNKSFTNKLLTERLADEDFNELLDGIVSNSVGKNSPTKNIANYAPAERPVFSHISEITTVSSSINFGLILLPIIQSLIQPAEKRWVTWVSENKNHLSWLKRANQRCLYLRNIYTEAREETLWALWEALAQGNSQLVVSQVRGLSEQEKRHLQMAAELGNCHLLLVA